MKLGKCYRERCFLSCHERGTKKKNSESHEEKHLSLFLCRAQNSPSLLFNLGKCCTPEIFKEYYCV